MNLSILARAVNHTCIHYLNLHDYEVFSFFDQIDKMTDERESERNHTTNKAKKNPRRRWESFCLQCFWKGTMIENQIHTLSKGSLASNASESKITHRYSKLRVFCGDNRIPKSSKKLGSTDIIHRPSLWSVSPSGLLMVRKSSNRWKGTDRPNLFWIIQHISVEKVSSIFGLDRHRKAKST